jgi:hypothetical protein
MKTGTSTVEVTDTTITTGKGGVGGTGGGPSPLAVNPPAGLTGGTGRPGFVAKIYPAS